MFRNKSSNLLFSRITPIAINEDSQSFRHQRDARYRRVDKLMTVQVEQPSTNIANTSQIHNATERSSVRARKPTFRDEQKEHVIREMGYRKLKDEAMNRLEDQIRQQANIQKARLEGIQRSVSKVDGLLRDMISNPIIQSERDTKLEHFVTSMSQPILPIVKNQHKQQSFVLPFAAKKGTFYDINKYMNFYDQLYNERNDAPHDKRKLSHYTIERASTNQNPFPTKVFYEYSRKTGCRVPNFIKS